jgi:hypothetical protein
MKIKNTLRKLYFTILCNAPKPIARHFEALAQAVCSSWIVRSLPHHPTFKRLKKSYVTLISTRTAKKVPPFIVRELKELAEIEPSLEPTPLFLSQFTMIREPDFSRLGILYANIYQACTTATYELIILSDRYPDTNDFMDVAPEKTLILLTSDRIQSKGVSLAQMLSSVKQSDQEIILSRLLLQLNIKKILLLHSSALGWSTFRKYSQALSSTMTIYASIDRRDVHVSDFLQNTYPYLKQIIFSDEDLRTAYLKELALPEKKLKIMTKDSAKPPKAPI